MAASHGGLLEPLSTRPACNTRTLVMPACNTRTLVMPACNTPILDMPACNTVIGIQHLFIYSFYESILHSIMADFGVTGLISWVGIQGRDLGVTWLIPTDLMSRHTGKRLIWWVAMQGRDLGVTWLILMGSHATCQVWCATSYALMISYMQHHFKWHSMTDMTHWYTSKYIQ